MRAGRLDQRVGLYQQADPRTRDAVGAVIDDYQLVSTVWAEAIPKGTRMFDQASASMSGIDVIFRVYDHHGIQPEWRISWDGREFDVIEYETDGRGEYGMIRAKSIRR